LKSAKQRDEIKAQDDDRDWSSFFACASVMLVEVAEDALQQLALGHPFPAILFGSANVARRFVQRQLHVLCIRD
jgi:hypothetical protein